jgi:subtilase family serine protease
VPDVAYNGDSSTGVPIYLGFSSDPGYYLFGGTSAGAPQWAGLIAIADQIAGHSLGFINPDLYAIGKDARSYAAAFHDITAGDNTQGSIQGYKAVPGWDPDTGLGSPRADFLIASLINQHLNRLANGNASRGIRADNHTRTVHRARVHRTGHHKARHHR